MTGTPAAHPDIRWAEDPYRAGESDPPPCGAVFSIEPPERHAKALAAHGSGRRRGSGRLHRRPADSEHWISRCPDRMSRAHASGQRRTGEGGPRGEENPIRGRGRGEGGGHVAFPGIPAKRRSHPS